MSVHDYAPDEVTPPTIAGFYIPHTDPARDIAKSIARADTTQGAPTLKQAIILAVSAATCTILLSGTAVNLSGVPFISSYYPQVNDLVWCVSMGGDIWILGAIGLQNQARDEVTLEYIPGAVLDTAHPGVFTTWITLGNVIVPDWAGSCDYLVSITGVYAVTTVPCAFRFRLGIATAPADNNILFTIATLNATNGYTGTVAWGGSFVANRFSAGTKSVVIQDMGISGGSMRVDLNSHISVRIIWRP